MASVNVLYYKLIYSAYLQIMMGGGRGWLAAEANKYALLCYHLVQTLLKGVCMRAIY